MTIWLDCIAIFISAISISICVFYYFKVIQTYKRDRLTGLMLRHNLSYEMEDNINRTYDIVLIDVDNFKLINDKYGKNTIKRNPFNILEIITGTSSYSNKFAVNIL